MKRFSKVLVYIVLGILILVGGALSYAKFALPNVGQAPELAVEITPARVERGKYLANNVSACIDCHSIRDWSRFSGPLDSNSLGAGGEKFDSRIGFPGEVYVPNITPHNLKTWTDGEIFRAITTGVKKDGSAIFPIMPYKSYGKMDKEDIYSIIAYLRTLPSKATDLPERKLDFPDNFIVNTFPDKSETTTIPSEDNRIEYGRYLVNAAACGDCHSKGDEGSEFSGGNTFQLPSGTVTSANITPDKETGIGSWTEEMFVNRFQLNADGSQQRSVGPNEFQTIMPWTMYGKMKRSDLEAIYAYLRTVAPVENRIVKFQP